MTNAQETRDARRDKVLRLVQTAMLAAIILLMAFTPLGYLKTAGLEITFIMIPVVIGAIVIGPTAGAVLGTIWGLTSFMQAFSGAFGMALLSISPVLTFILCVPTRILAGWLSGLIYKAIAAIPSKSAKLIACPAASLSVALLNTVLFMSTLILLFGRSDYITGLMNGKNVIAFILVFVGIQGAIEAAITLVAGGAVSAALVLRRGKKT